jgi:uncharacterized protein with GYD domain
MSTYIILAKYTQQGLATIKSAPERVKQVRTLAEKLGGKYVGGWLTMGEYDRVTVVDFPDDQSVAALVLAVEGWGSVTAQTMRAFNEEEFAHIVSKLP